MGRSSTAGAVSHARAVVPVSSLAVGSRLPTALGLHVEHYDDDYAWVRNIHGDELWHIRVEPGLDPTTNPTSLYVFVHDPDEARAALVAAGFAPNAVETMPWGMREFEVHDEDGTHVRLGRNL